MPRPVHWRDLIPGLAVLALIALGALAVLRYARVGALHGDTIGLVVFTGDAGDLTNGSEVWLAGQKVGLVDAIDFREPGSDTARRLRIGISVRAEAQPLLRADSRARVAKGGSLLGASVLALSVGSPGAAVLEAGDTIRAVGSAPVAGDLTTSLSEVRIPLAELTDNVVALTQAFGGQRGTVGAAVNGRPAAEVGRLARALSAVMDRTSDGTGTVDLLLRDVELRRRLTRTAARADSLRQLLAGGSGTLGRFRRDSTLVRQIAGVRDEVTILRALVGTPTGTVGRARTDGAIAAGLAELETELTTLVDDVKRHPLRYVVF